MSLDLEERKKLIEQVKQEQKAEFESIINEHKAKVSIYCFSKTKI